MVFFSLAYVLPWTLSRERWHLGGHEQKTAWSRKHEDTKYEFNRVAVLIVWQIGERLSLAEQ